MSFNGDPRTALTGLLNRMIEMGGSDLHLRVDSPPQVRLHGQMVVLDDFESLTPEDTRDLAFSFLSDEQRRIFEAKKEFDFSIGLDGLSRFRVNIFNQKETVGGVFRAIPYEIKSFEELGLPHVVADLCRKPRGLVLVTGPTGSGKSTTLATMIDKINV
ncbi:MAG: ATPase, T2SS/T4P/T4SS family, partial [Acidobacteriota bacterium]